MPGAVYEGLQHRSIHRDSHIRRKQMQLEQSRRYDLARTLLWTITIFELLGSIDAGYERRERDVTQVVRRFFARNYHLAPHDVARIMPLLIGAATLPIFTPAFEFGSTLDDAIWEKIGFTMEKEFEISLHDFDVPTQEPKPKTVLQVIAGACRDFVECAADDRFESTIRYDGGKVLFTVPGYRLEFCSEFGLDAFIQAYIKVLSRAVREVLLSEHFV
jgi:hypothetical protein